MKKVVIATVLVACAAALWIFVFAAEPAKVVVKSAPAIVALSNLDTQSGLADYMSLPMPLGLKGDPAKGGAFFMSNCFTCHGVNGDGNGPRAYFITPQPRNFLLETSRQKLNRPVLFEAITNGRLGTNMPAWGKVLNNQEIADVAEFVFQHFINAPQVNTPGNTPAQ